MFFVFMDKCKLLVLVFLVYINVVQANQYSEVGLPVAQTFGIKEHGGSDQNWVLTQAENGLIYSGTGTGIIEWDGEKWHLYNTPNNSRVRSISLWRDGHIYAGTIDDLGAYQPNSQGKLQFTSLVRDWTAEQRQFGEVWSTVANKDGVMFVTNKALYYWDGKQVHIVKGAPGGKHRIFALDDGFVFKTVNDESLYKINVDTSSATPVFKIKNTGLVLPTKAFIRSVFYNNNNKLIVVTSSDGIFEKLTNALEKRVEGQLFGPDNHLYNAIQARDGYYYLVSIKGGLYILDSSLQIVAQYLEQHNVGANKLYSVLEDQQGSIWLSGTPNVTKIIPPHRVSAFKPGTQSTIIDRLVPIDGKLVATGDGVFQIESGESGYAPAAFEPLIASNEIYFDALEYKNHFLYGGSGGLFARSIDTPNQVFKNVLQTAWARSLKVDPVTGTLVVSTYEGLFLVEYIDGHWTSNKVANTEDELEFVAIEDNGVIWAGTTSQELYRIENAQFSDRQTQVNKFIDTDGLGPGNVMPFKLSSGVVIATSNGLMDYRQDRTPALQFMSGFPAIFRTPKEDVFRLFEDDKGRIWFRIGQQIGYVEKDKDGVWNEHSKLFAPFASGGLKDFTSTSNEVIWFAQNSGDVYRANVDLAEQVPLKGKLNIRYITNLDSKAIIDGGQLLAAESIKLDQTNNSIRIEFALSNNSILNPTMYRQRLLGSGHNEWSEWATEHHKDYTLLSGGDYQFQVEAQDDWRRIYQSELTFYVKPVWYLSQLAWLFYTLALIILLTLTGWLTQRWRTSKLKIQNLILEDTVAERTREIKSKVEELEQQQILKERFFANVSHEFRTPLTLTIAPLQDLLREHPELQQGVVFPVETALRNANKMLELVGHILDINRLEAGQFPLHIAENNIAELVNLVAPRFNNWATQHQQTITIRNSEDPVLLYFDRDQLEKCISNLLSNAIKYSGSQTEIAISIIKQQSRFGIEVKDNGVGVELELQDTLFERFYQGKSSEQVSQPGTGIGLALIRELMELHHGQVELISQAGQGCCFTLWLKRGHEHFDESQLRENIALPSDNEIPILPDVQLPAFIAKEAASIEALSQKEDDITTVLVVDDNNELRQFISLKLSGYYRIIQACDGAEGLAKTLSMLPDLIISDVMMPKMNGLEMLAEIRKNKLTSTTPIIMLSTKSGKRETVEGLQTGADDYMSKPFDTSELIARIDGLIRNRKMIREEIQAELALSLTTKSITDKSEDSFADKMRNEIMQNLTNPDFNIDMLAQALALSRRSLSRKCQQECQQSAGQFITDVRMQTALKLLNKNRLNVSEIAYGTGYESLSYFSRTFKKFYGKSPTSIND
jgi:signal transduction histidine kinase/DNA-binding response OmpR family regulator/ligand-binding sensor domain-containing protein